MRSLVLLACALVLPGCGPADPREQRIDNIQDQAAAEAQAIADSAGNEATRMRTEADTLAARAGTSTGYDAERLETRVEALRKEAKIVERQAEAKAQAVKDRAKAEVSTLRAQ